MKKLVSYVTQHSFLIFNLELKTISRRAARRLIIWHSKLNIESLCQRQTCFGSVKVQTKGCPSVKGLMEI